MSGSTQSGCSLSRCEESVPRTWNILEHPSMGQGNGSLEANTGCMCAKARVEASSCEYQEMGESCYSPVAYLALLYRWRNHVTLIQPQAGAKGRHRSSGSCGEKASQRTLEINQGPSYHWNQATSLLLEVSLRSLLVAQSSWSVHVRTTNIELASSGGNLNFFNPGSREKEGELYLTYATDDQWSYPNT